MASQGKEGRMSFRIRGRFRSRRHAQAVYNKVKDTYWEKKLAEKNERISTMRKLLGTGDPVDLVKELKVSAQTVMKYVDDCGLAPGCSLVELSDGRFQLRKA
jgi:hypothetical protein